MRPPPGTAEHGRRGRRRAPLLLSRLGLPRERPHLADTVPAQGGRPAAARGPCLPGPRGLRPGVRLPGRPAGGGHDRATRVAGVRFRQAHDHDVLPHRSLPLLVHAREPPRHEPPVPAPRHPRQDPAQAPRLRHRPAIGAGPVPVHSCQREEGPRRRPARRRGHRRRHITGCHHHPHRVPLPDPPVGPRGCRTSRVFPLGGLRARGCRAANQSRLRPAHDREAPDPGRPSSRLAVHPALHRARVRRGPDGGRGRAAGLGRARRGLEPRGLPADPRRPRRAAQQRRTHSSRIRAVRRRRALQPLRHPTKSRGPRRR